MKIVLPVDLAVMQMNSTTYRDQSLPRATTPGPFRVVPHTGPLYRFTIRAKRQLSLSSF